MLSVVMCVPFHGGTVIKIKRVENRVFLSSAPAPKPLLCGEVVNASETLAKYYANGPPSVKSCSWNVSGPADQKIYIVFLAFEVSSVVIVRLKHRVIPVLVGYICIYNIYLST